MANNKEISIEMIAQIATMAAKTAVDELLERRQEEVFTRHRGGISGVKQHRHNGHSPACTYADKVKNTLNNQNTYKSKNISMVKDTREKPIIIQQRKEIIEQSNPSDSVI